MKEIVLLILLGIYSYWDIKEKKLPVIWLRVGVVVSGILGLSESLLVKDMNIVDIVCELIVRTLPGALLFLFACGSNGKVGCGDGMLMAVIGLTTGMHKMLCICMLSFGVSFVYSCFLVLFQKKDKEYTFPFAPFCFLGTAGLFLMGI